jgi:hypothetical protein
LTKIAQIRFLDDILANNPRTQTLAPKNFRVLGLEFGFSTQTQTQTQKPIKPKFQTQTQTQNTKKFGSKNPKTQNFLGFKIPKIKFYG